jgi:hypothetical protein
MRVRPVPLLVAVFGTAAAASVLVAVETLRHGEPPAAREPASRSVPPPSPSAPPRAIAAGTGSIDGAIVDPAGRSLAGVHVRAVSRAAPASTDRFETRTDFDGRFRLDGVVSGAAEVVAHEEGVLAGVGRVVDVAAGGTSRIELVLPEAGVLAGRVRAAGRPAPADTTVVATAMGGGAAVQQVARAVLDAAGSFRLRLPAGEYRVHPAPADAAPEDVRSRPAFVRVDPGRTTAVELALAQASGPRVEILVREPGGEPSTGAEVTLARAGDARVALATAAGVDGRARVAAEGIAGHDVVLRARNGGRTAEQRLTLPAAGTVELRLAPGGAVEGIVRGAGARELTIEVAIQAAAGVWRTVDLLRVPGDRFAVADLPPGALRIAARASDGRRGEAELRIAAGERRAVEIALR